ncbi:MAG: permease [Bacteroidales bacterium]|nr:permease [Bacteroidales bacterium]
MNQFIHLINEMSPYLLLGFFIAGVMHAFIPGRYYSKYLSKPNFMSVLNAAILGIPLPLCSCGVIPTAMSLRKEGASKGAVTSFLIATPQTGVDSILATYSIMGWPFAIIRPIAALVTSLFGGAVVSAVDEKEIPEVHTDEKSSSATTKTFWDRIVEALKYAFVDMMGDIGKWLVIGLVVAGAITLLVPDSFFAVFQSNTWASMLLVLCLAVPM